MIASVESIKKEAEELRQKSAQSGQEISELIEQRNNLDKRSAELRTLERNKGQEREKLSAEIVRLDERKIAMRKEYDELNDMLFEQYELTRREAEALNIQIENMQVAKKRLHEIKVAIKKSMWALSRNIKRFPKDMNFLKSKPMISKNQNRSLIRLLRISPFQ